MTDAPDTAPANPDIFREEAVPERLMPFVRRIMLADTLRDTAFSFDVHATGYCYLGWVWRGRWTGDVNGKRRFDTDRDGAVFCSGQVLNSRIEGAVSGQPGTIFVEFQPFGHYQLLGIACKLTIDHAAPPDVMNPELGAALQRLRAAGPDMQGREALPLMIETLDTLAETARPLPQNLLEAARRIEAVDGALRIGPLCEKLGLSQRTFQRRFQQLTGLSPKRFCRILQVTKAFNAMLKSQNAPLSEIALNAGFSDQAHFTRVFREYLDNSPLQGAADVEATLAKFVGRARG